jgi:hypothetical protein
VLYVRIILVGLVLISPVFLLFDGLVACGVLAGVTAAGLLCAGWFLRSREREFLISTIKPLLIAAGVPVLWMVIQVIPLPPLAHPFWASVESALGRRIAGTISIDPGDSIITLGQYLSLTVLAFLSAAVSVDRRRAEWVLFSLIGACTTTALIGTGDLLIGNFAQTSSEPDQVTASMVLGVVIAAAACVRAIERYEARNFQERPALGFLRNTGLCGVALGVCVLALVLVGTKEEVFASGCGLAALFGVVIIRRFRLSLLGTTVVLLGFLVTGVLVVASQAENGRKLPLAFAAASSISMAASERVLNDAPVTGTGAGTFAALAPVYDEIDDPPLGKAAATTAASIAIELGSPFLWLILAATAFVILLLLQASLRRGRDSFYASMGAGCLLALLLLLFMNAGCSGIEVGLISATLIGLAVAQSKSRAIKA